MMIMGTYPSWTGPGASTQGEPGVYPVWTKWDWGVVEAVVIVAVGVLEMSATCVSEMSTRLTGSSMTATDSALMWAKSVSTSFARMVSVMWAKIFGGPDE